MNDSRGKRRISGVVVGVLALVVAGCSASTEKIDAPFVANAAHPAPAQLLDSQSWIFVGRTAYVPGKILQMTWHKPSPTDPNQWTESFQYEDIAAPLDGSTVYQLQQLHPMKLGDPKLCPSGSITQIMPGKFLMEIKSGGCPRYGAIDEIDYYPARQRGFYFFAIGPTDTEHVAYIVKSADMTPAQRQAGIAAVTSFDPANAAP